MAETYSVLLEKLIEQMELENVTKDVDVSRIEIVQTDTDHWSCRAHIYGAEGSGLHIGNDGDHHGRQ